MTEQFMAYYYQIDEFSHVFRRGLVLLHTKMKTVWLSIITNTTWSLRMPIKGQCHELFDLRFFHESVPPQSSECSIGAISNFFENFMRYLLLKVHHQWQMEKIFINQKSFNYFVQTPLGSIVKIKITLFPSSSLFGVSSLMLFQLFATGGKFTTGVYSLIPMVIWHQYQLRQWYRWQNLLLLSLTPVVHLDLRISP